MKTSIKYIWFFFLVFLLQPIWVNAKIWNYYQITNNQKNDRNPSIDGNEIVWNGYNENGKYCVLYLNLQEGQIKDITTGNISGHFGMPRISRGKIALRSYDRIETQNYYMISGSHFEMIYSAHVGSFPPYWGYKPSYESIEPNIDGNQITFAAWDGHDYEIYLWNNGILSQITNNDTDDYEPQIYDGQITFTGWGGDEYTREDIFYWNGIQTINISNGMKEKNEDSSVWNNRSAWIGRSYDYDNYWDIYITDLNTLESNRVCLVPQNDFEPVLNDSYVLWHNQTLTNGNYLYKIYLHDGYKLFEVGFNGINSLNPQVYEDKFVFNAWDGNDFEIFLATYTAGKYKPSGWSGNYQGIEIINNLAYVTRSTNGLAIFDISNPVNPELSGIYRDGSQVFDVAIKGSYAFLACREKGVQIIDISVPEKPLLIKTINTIDAATGGTVFQDYLYIGDRAGGLFIVDISVPSEAEIISRLDLPGLSLNIDADEEYVYISNYHAGFSIVNIADISNPQLIVNKRVGFVFDVAVRKNFVYLTCPNFGIRIMDISNPSVPIEIGNCKVPFGDRGWRSPVCINITDKYAFISAGTQGLFPIDIGDPRTPFIVEKFDTPGFCWSNGIKDEYLYVTDFECGLVVYDISDYNIK